MLDIIRKKDFFRWWDEGIADHDRRELKLIQDAWILATLTGGAGRRIAEIGGGHSRVLEKLKRGDECWNIDRFEGVGQGPTKPKESEGVRVVEAYMGDFDDRLEGNFFDVVFSISVVEHVPKDGLRDFFMDCGRVLKPGGLMLHAIDLYVFDEPRNLTVVDAYRKVGDDPEYGLEWVEPPRIDSSVTFRCDYASNPDMTMANWNHIAPHLREQREVSQSVSIAGGWRKR